MTTPSIIQKMKNLTTSYIIIIYLLMMLA